MWRFFKVGSLFSTISFTENGSFRNHPLKGSFGKQICSSTASHIIFLCVYGLLSVIIQGFDGGNDKKPFSTGLQEPFCI